MENHEAFNRFAGKIFAREYERETGVQLRFKGIGGDFGKQFPDVLLERIVDKWEIGVEFVLIALGFFSQEQTYFEQSYRKEFYHILEASRPRYKNWRSPCNQACTAYKRPAIQTAQRASWGEMFNCRVQDIPFSAPLASHITGHIA